MAGWMRFHQPTTATKYKELMKSSTSTNHGSMSKNNFSSYLPEVYAGHPQRIDRYNQYDVMDQDSEINASLDTIADFSTRPDPTTNLSFEFYYNGTPSDSIVNILQGVLNNWNSTNNWKKKLWKLFRNTIKYGDQFFIRDPETFELYWVNPSKVEKIIVDETKGKTPTAYVMRDLDLNIMDKVVAKDEGYGQNIQGTGTNTLNTQNVTSIRRSTQGGQTNSRFEHSNNATVVDATHVVHVSLSEGLDANWPFGTSVLEPLFKTFTQKSLLEDAIIIYRIQRAPERRIFYIDTGDMKQDKAQRYLDKIKMEINQRRIPSKNGGSGNVVDSTYNAQSMLEDFYFQVGADGRGSRVETLPGGENLGCFSMDTKIKLLDGRDLSISEIERELKEGKPLWTYSVNPIFGDIVPGKISWAGTTRKNAEVVKVTLDNGESFICTPDHKFPIKGLGFKEIQDLAEGQSLMGVYTRNEKIGNGEYVQIFDLLKQDWVFVHRMVADYFKGTVLEKSMLFDGKYEEAKKDVRHHVNFDRFDNSPENLAWMNYQDHILYHSSLGFTEEEQLRGTVAAKEKMASLRINNPSEYQSIINRQVAARKEWRNSLSVEESEEINKKISDGIIKYINNLSDDDLENRNAISVRNLELANTRNKELMSDPLYRENRSNQLRQAWIDLNNDPERLAKRNNKISEANLERWKIEDYYDRVFLNQKLRFDGILLSMTAEAFVAGFTKKSDLVAHLSNDTSFMEHFKTLNHKVHTNTNLSEFTERHLIKMLEAAGTTWYKFKATHTNIVVDDKLRKLCEKLGEKSQTEFIQFISTDEDTGSILNLDTITRFTFDKFLKSYNIDNFDTFRGLSENVNHRIVKIEKIETRMDVGTLSIDADEEFHDYHTYALSAGVFAKNSIDDLKYFNNKLIRGLRIPSSYIPTGPEDGSATFSDGRVGTAYIQEFRFANYCERLQNLIASTLENEFKLFVKLKGYNIDSSTYGLELVAPQNFRQFAQIEEDAAMIANFQSLMDVPYLSPQFLIRRFLNLTEDEIADNERYWSEENDETASGGSGSSVGGEMPGLGSIGFDAPSETFDDENIDDTDGDALSDESEPTDGQDELNVDLGD